MFFATSQSCLVANDIKRIAWLDFPHNLDESFRIMAVSANTINSALESNAEFKVFVLDQLANFQSDVKVAAKNQVEAVLEEKIRDIVTEVLGRSSSQDLAVNTKKRKRVDAEVQTDVVAKRAKTLPSMFTTIRKKVIEVATNASIAMVVSTLMGYRNTTAICNVPRLALGLSHPPSLSVE